MLNAKKNQRIKILDSIRGIAALVVLFHHIFKLNVVSFQAHLNEEFFLFCKFVSEINHEAVLIFFIISGISIGLTISKTPVTSVDSYNQYLYRRFKRILPIYWISLAFALFFGILMGQSHLEDFGPLNLLGNLLFLQTSSTIEQSWFVPYGLNGPLWSLAFEMFFYLLFPILFVLNRRFFKHVRLEIKYVMMLVIALICIGFNTKVIFIPYLLFFVSFLIWYQGYVMSKYLTEGKTNHPFFLGNALIGLCIILFPDVIPSNTLQVVGKGFCIAAFFYLFMIVFAKYPLTRLSNTINRVFFDIGEGSYAIYALHYPILLYFQMQSVALSYQLIAMGVYIILCIKLERVSIKWKVNFLNINYFWPVKNLQGSIREKH